MNATATPNPLPESLKMFLEHVRTVHFTLLAACLALFASLLVEPKADLEIAKRDVERIRSALRDDALQKLPTTPPWPACALRAGKAAKTGLTAFS